MSNWPELINKLRESIRNGALWKPRQPLLVAVSGGIDSMVLMDLLRRLPLSERPKITVAHFNHQLRGRESDQDARFVQKKCRDFKLPVVIGKGRLASDSENLQDKAREQRYRFLVRTARRLKLKKIVTAHQATDQAETFLIRWLQGAGLRGLAGIPMIRGEGIKVIRPFLFVTRAEITDYARRFKISYREDSSNRKPKYLRNRVRKVLTGLMRINPRLDYRSALNMVLLRADDDYLDQQAQRHLKRSREKFPLATYRRLPAALRYRILKELAARQAGDSLRWGSEFILQLDRMLYQDKSEMKYSLPGRVCFRKTKEGFGFSRRVS